MVEKGLNVIYYYYYYYSEPERSQCDVREWKDDFPTKKFLDKKTPEF